jgi:hypothetical protein
MELKNFSYSVSATITLSREEMDYIITCGENHYDSTCKNTAKGYKNRFDDSKEDITFNLSFREMDIISKMLESETSVKNLQFRGKWRGILWATRDESDRVNAFWMMNDTYSYTPTWRAKLREKHGDQKINPKTGTAMLAI